MQTIGVLGGLGPQATMDFEARVHREAQRRVPPRFNSGYPPMVVAYLRHPPILFGDDGRPRQPLEPDPRLFEAARRLGDQADFLVIPSNFPHTYRREIEAAAVGAGWGCSVSASRGSTSTPWRRASWPPRPSTANCATPWIARLDGS